MTTGRRGQLSPDKMDARYVAVLILLIALFMVMYILFVPPEQRRVILEQELDTGTTTPGTPTTGGGEEILAVSPGELAPKKEVVQEHTLSPVNIFVKTEPKTTQLASSLVVKTSLLGRQAPALTFQVEDSDVKKVRVFFSVVGQPRGELTLQVNRNVFFTGELGTGVRVVDVPLSFVKDTNRLEFRVEHPGLAFWATNTYEVKDVGVKLEFERINAQEMRAFVLSEKEQKDVLSAKLSYFQVCHQPLQKQTTNLKVYVNDESAFSGFIRCVNVKQTLEFDKDVLVAGRNTVRFLLEEGDFSLNDLSVIVESREAEFPTYSFIIDQDHVKKMNAGKKLMLEMVFANANQEKVARVFIGEKNFIMRTEAGTFTKDVSSFVQEGTNFVRLVPSNTFNVVSLRLVVV